MKDMTTAEFAKANLAALEEPVSIRRYTTVVGTYYPKGYEPIHPIEPSPQVELPVPDETIKVGREAKDLIRELEDEVARLKRELAARPAAPVGSELIGQPAQRTVPKRKMSDDAFFADLPRQDREFFERKLGKKR